MTKPRVAQVPGADRVAVAGGAACPRCAETMQRYKRPEGYKPNGAAFAPVTLWDRCAACNFIQRLEETTLTDHQPEKRK
jgi:hypothetical protein